jgi:hypothetical protein
VAWGAVAFEAAEIAPKLTELDAANGALDAAVDAVAALPDTAPGETPTMT